MSDERHVEARDALVRAILSDPLVALAREFMTEFMATLLKRQTELTEHDAASIAFSYASTFMDRARKEVLSRGALCAKPSPHGGACVLDVGHDGDHAQLASIDETSRRIVTWPCDATSISFGMLGDVGDDLGERIVAFSRTLKEMT